ARFRETEAALREAQIRLLTAEQALANLGLPVRADEWKGLRSEDLAARVRLLGLAEGIVRSLDPRTITANLLPLVAPLDGVAVRADLDNSAGTLRANAFGSGRIVLREERQAIVVPSEAVHWEGDCHVVFVRDRHFFEPAAPKVFHVRTVRPGAKEGPYTEVL